MLWTDGHLAENKGCFETFSFCLEQVAALRANFRACEWSAEEDSLNSDRTADTDQWVMLPLDAAMPLVDGVVACLLTP